MHHVPRTERLEVQRVAPGISFVALDDAAFDAALQASYGGSASTAADIELAEPDLAARVNVEELPLVTGVELLACVPNGAAALDAQDFGALAWTMFGEFAGSLLG